MKSHKFFLISFGVFNIFLVFLLYINNFIDFQSFVMLFIIANIFVWSQINKYQEEYLEKQKINKALKKLLENDFEVRLAPEKNNNKVQIGTNFNKLVKKIDDLAKKRSEGKQTIKILTENIQSPIIFINCNGVIKYVNKKFMTSFNIPNIYNCNYEKMHNTKINKFIDDAFIYEKKMNNQIRINSEVYEALATPIFDKNENFHGSLFIFHNITELKKYENLQKEFLTNASHELKSPISAIKGCSEILLSGAKEDKEALDEFLNIIQKENYRMEMLVKDLLMISRIEHEQILINTQLFKFDELIRECINLVNYHLKKKKQYIKTDYNKDIEIYGDYERLKQVFINLIQNAINYSEEKEILISCYESGKKVIIKVRDNGIGISEKDLPHVFERFYRVDDSRARDTGGTGLGLSIVKSIVEAHHGTVSIESSLGLGTEITIKLNKK